MSDLIAHSRASTAPIRVFLTCPGLGHVRRGYETFAQACFNALKDRPELELTLFKGAGPSSRQEKRLGVIGRETRLARWIGAPIGKGPYFAEALSFSLKLLPHVIRHRPQVIYFHDHAVGEILWHWRKISGARFRLLFGNSAPIQPPFHHCDHVQQAVPGYFEDAISAGQPRQTMTLLPLGIDAPKRWAPLSSENRLALRRKLQLPEHRYILLSVCALNSVHKRVDYVIREVAAMPADRRPFLVLLGQRDAETPAIENLARKCLESTGYLMATVPSEQVSDYYDAADCFTLASLSEGFGLVVGEAMARGLPCLTHDYGVMKYVLGDTGYRADVTKQGALRGLIEKVCLNGSSDEQRLQIRESVMSRFGWDALADQYVDLIRRCARVPASTTATDTVEPALVSP